VAKNFWLFAALAVAVDGYFAVSIETCIFHPVDSFMVWLNVDNLNFMY
jgi:hypothetical protein